MSEATAPVNSRLSKLELRISNLTWFIVLLLSLRGIYEFYGMKNKGLLEQALIYVTQPLVQPFQWSFIQGLEIPALPIFLAAISLLAFSKWARLRIHRKDLNYFRLRRALASQAITAVSYK